jgi:5-methylcytosine-specific restriction enzyme A
MTKRPTIAHVDRRSTLEWQGKHPDADPPSYVRLRVFNDKKGKCHMCGHVIRAGEKWICEHVIAIANGGENRETNLDLTCHLCLPKKNKADKDIQTKTENMRKAAFGIKPKSRLRSRSTFQPFVPRVKQLHEDVT